MLGLSRFSERFFAVYANLLIKRTWCFIVIPLLVAMVLACGWFRFSMDVEDDFVKLFTPIDSPWAKDRELFKKFFEMEESAVKFVMLSVKNYDAKGILNNNASDEALRIANHIERNLTVDYNGQILAYRNDFVSDTSPYRRPNALVLKLLDVFDIDKPILRTRWNLEYPITTFQGENVFLPLSVGGVTTKDKSLEVAGARSILLRLIVQTGNKTQRQIAKVFEEKLQMYSEQVSRESDLIEVAAYSWESVGWEVRKNTYITLPQVPSAVSLVLIFAVLVCSTNKLSTSCHCHAVAGLTSVILSFGAGLGTILLCGIRYNDLVSVTAFIALAIGVDDMFIMLEAWKRRNYLPVQQRLQETLAEAGSSIMFTSVTDVLAFGIGASMKVPALRNFCIFTATAIGFDFIYQVTFFPAAMILNERYSRDIQLRILDKLKGFYRKKTQNQVGTAQNGHTKEVNWSRGGNLRTPSADIEVNVQVKISAPEKQNHRFLPCRWNLADMMTQAVTKPFYQICLIVLTTVLVVLAVVGAAKMRPNANLSKLLIDKTDAHHHLSLFDKDFWSTALQFEIIVKSPDLRNQSDVDDFKKFLHRVENFSPLSMGADSTNIWLTEFLIEAEWGYGGSYPEAFQQYYWMILYGNRNIKTFTTDDGLVLPSYFHFSTGMWSSPEWNVRAALLTNISKLREEFPQFEPVFYNDITFMTDLLIYTEVGLKQTLGIVLLVTFAVTTVFLPWDHPLLVFWVSTTFLAINTSVLGFLSWWNVDIDAISMVTLMMSVGFSVDYTVHMAFQFSRQIKTAQSREEAVIDTFESVARPILFSGLSTLVTVFPMVFVHSYMMRVFLKTIVLVVLNGLFQSLLVLPALLYLTAKLKVARPAECANNSDGLRRKLSISAQEVASSHSVLNIFKRPNQSAVIFTPKYSTANIIGTDKE